MGDHWRHAFVRLTDKLRIYLTGFLESRIRPESQKITQKVAGKKYDGPPFTLPAFTKTMVDFQLQIWLTGFEEWGMLPVV
jgi:hypothetical protein